MNDLHKENQQRAERNKRILESADAKQVKTMVCRRCRRLLTTDQESENLHRVCRSCAGERGGTDE